LSTDSASKGSKAREMLATCSSDKSRMDKGQSQGQKDISNQNWIMEIQYDTMWINMIQYEGRARTTSAAASFWRSLGSSFRNKS
jgi:hypothetical protein